MAPARANEKLASYAHALVSNARDQGIAPRDPAGRRRARSRAASVNSKGEDASSGYGDQANAATAAVGQLLSRGKAAISALQPPQPSRPARPALSHRASSRPYPTTAMATSLPSPGNSPDDSPAETPPPSVELSSIVPDETRPPTVLLSRQNLGSFFQSTRAPKKLTTATRFTGDLEPLTDRYGFICMTVSDHADTRRHSTRQYAQGCKPSGNSSPNFPHWTRTGDSYPSASATETKGARTKQATKVCSSAALIFARPHRRLL